MRLLVDCREVFASREDPEALFTVTLIEALVAIDTAPWAEMPGKSGQPSKPLDVRGLSGLLKKYGIKSASVRRGEATGKGYRIKDFSDAWERYVSVTASQPKENKDLRGNGSVTTSPGVTDEKAAKSSETLTCDETAVLHREGRRKGEGRDESRPSPESSFD